MKNDISGRTSPSRTEPYELRYAILRRLLDAGVVAAPLDFDNRANNLPADVGNLVFLIKAGSVASFPSALALPN